MKKSTKNKKTDEIKETGSNDNNNSYSINSPSKPHVKVPSYAWKVLAILSCIATMVMYAELVPALLTLTRRVVSVVGVTAVRNTSRWALVSMTSLAMSLELPMKAANWPLGVMVAFTPWLPPVARAIDAQQAVRVGLHVADIGVRLSPRRLRHQVGGMFQKTTYRPSSLRLVGEGRVPQRRVEDPGRVHGDDPRRPGLHVADEQGVVDVVGVECGQVAGEALEQNEPTARRHLRLDQLAVGNTAGGADADELGSVGLEVSAEDIEGVVRISGTTGRMCSGR